jgi:hypothetical protein
LYGRIGGFLSIVKFCKLRASGEEGFHPGGQLFCRIQKLSFRSRFVPLLQRFLPALTIRYIAEIEGQFLAGLTIAFWRMALSLTHNPFWITIIPRRRYATGRTVTF